VSRDDPSDTTSSFLGILVFPHPNNCPPRLPKQAVSLGIAFTVLHDFLSPKVFVAPRRPMMFRASVPEAAIQEYGDASTSEHEVSGPANRWQWSRRDSVAQAKLMHMGSKR